MTKRTKDDNQSWVATFIDRIEGDVAVIILSESPEIHLNLPLHYLPLGVIEGDHLKLSFELDTSSTEAARHRVAVLQSELSPEPETNIKL
jgi:hypothetical protein